MIPLIDLWLPVLVSAALVFVVSSLVHMVLKWHNSDARPLPNEDKALAALRSAGVTPGEYRFPYCSTMKDMGTQEFAAKLASGPVGNMTVVPSGPIAMGRSLLQWFVLCIVIGVFVAYTASLVLPRGADYSVVFRFTGTVAVLGYAFGSVSNSIWKGVPWSSTAKYFVDGVAYGLVTAGAFGWLWPK